ncbi:fanconi-associated nuclease 1 homolog [Rosa rugosa]|uniref:fanconi-associated nuclease 1 homolog n=1 Tax=Rosa rugosa TaxID=74645 RepID=UPI002B4171CC|nr:fanconi-associated nuclease 1 homolog [Rosa rugosa]
MMILRRSWICSLYLSYVKSCASLSSPLLPSMVLHRTGSCVRICSNAESFIWRAERLFFLNGEQDLSAFLLVYLGIIKYPTYKCIVSEQIFSAQDDLLGYEEAIEVAQIVDEALDGSNTGFVLKCIKIADSHLSNPVQSLTSESWLHSFPTFQQHLSTRKWFY